MKKLMVPLLVLLVCAFLITGCSSPSSIPSSTAPISSSVPAASKTPTSVASPSVTSTSSAGTPQYGGVLRVIGSSSPSTLGWFAQNGLSADTTTPPCIEALLRCDFYNVITPLLAENYSIAPDMKSITLNIRKGVKFHDGTTLDGAAVKWNLDQLKAAALSSTSKWTTIELVDDYTVRLNVSEYANTLLNGLAGAAYIVSPTAFKEKGKDYLLWHPVGTGPFKFVSYEKDVAVKFTKNPDYWQKGKPYLDGIEMLIINDTMTQASSFQEKEGDAIGGDMAKQALDLTSKGYPWVGNPGGIFTLISDSGNPDSPFAKLKVRQALDYAIDRDAVTKAIGFGFKKPNLQLAYLDTPNYVTDVAPRNYDPDKAKQLLKEAGYPDGFKCSLTADGRSADRDAMTAVQGFLGKVGIVADLQIVDYATFNKLRTSGWKNGLLSSPLGIDANYNSTIDRYYAKNSVNFISSLRTDEFDAIYQQSLHTLKTDPALMQQMVRYIYDNAAITCLWSQIHGTILQPYVHDTGFQSLQSWPGWLPEQAWISK
jgi:peptide/nickel transport system substrate-binding protein